MKRKYNFHYLNDFLPFPYSCHIDKAAQLGWMIQQWVHLKSFEMGKHLDSRKPKISVCLELIKSIWIRWNIYIKYAYNGSKDIGKALMRYLLYRKLFLISILNQDKTTAANGSLLVSFILIEILFRDYASKVTRNLFWRYHIQYLLVL